MGYTATSSGHPFDASLARVHCVGEPDVAARPAEVLGILQGRTPEFPNAELFFVFGFCQMGVQTEPRGVGRVPRYPA